MKITYPVLRAMQGYYGEKSNVTKVLIDEILLAHLISQEELKPNETNHKSFREGYLQIDVDVYPDTLYSNIIISDLEAYWKGDSIENSHDYEKLEMYIEEWYYQEPTHTSDEFLKPIGE